MKKLLFIAIVSLFTSCSADIVSVNDEINAETRGYDNINPSLVYKGDNLFFNGKLANNSYNLLIKRYLKTDAVGESYSITHLNNNIQLVDSHIDNLCNYEFYVISIDKDIYPDFWHAYTQVLRDEINKKFNTNKSYDFNFDGIKYDKIVLCEMQEKNNN